MEQIFNNKSVKQPVSSFIIYNLVRIIIFIIITRTVSLILSALLRGLKLPFKCLSVLGTLNLSERTSNLRLLCGCALLGKL